MFSNTNKMNINNHTSLAYLVDVVAARHELLQWLDRQALKQPVQPRVETIESPRNARVVEMPEIGWRLSVPIEGSERLSKHELTFTLPRFRQSAQVGMGNVHDKRVARISEWPLFHITYYLQPQHLIFSTTQHASYFKRSLYYLGA